MDCSRSPSSRTPSPSGELEAPVDDMAHPRVASAFLAYERLCGRTRHAHAIRLRRSEPFLEVEKDVDYQKVEFETEREVARWSLHELEARVVSMNHVDHVLKTMNLPVERYATSDDKLNCTA